MSINGVIHFCEICQKATPHLTDGHKTTESGWDNQTIICSVCGTSTSAGTNDYQGNLDAPSHLEVAVEVKCPNCEETLNSQEDILECEMCAIGKGCKECMPRGFCPGCENSLSKD